MLRSGFAVLFPVLSMISFSAQAAVLGKQESIALIDALKQAGAPVFVSKDESDPAGLEFEVDAFADQIAARRGTASVQWNGKSASLSGSSAARLFDALESGGLSVGQDGGIQASSIECHGWGRMQGPADSNLISAECTLSQ